jgi:hypothetical protein
MSAATREALDHAEQLERRPWECEPETVTYYAFAYAKPGHFLPGGVKRWASQCYATRAEAEDVRQGYTDGLTCDSGIGQSQQVA